MTQSDVIKVFISHTSADSDLARALIRLLRSALPLSEDDIRCTSLSGYKLEPGADTDSLLRIEVNQSTILIGLLTPQSLTSSYVLFELGARWGIERKLVPLLGGGADFDSLPGPLKGKNALRAEDRGDLLDMLNLLSTEIGIKLSKTSAYDHDIGELIAASKKKAPQKQSAI